MAHDLKSILVLHPGYDEIDAIKPFLDQQKVMPCQVLDSESPYYLRLKVVLSPQDEDICYTEILLPHAAVLFILIDAPEKKLGPFHAKSPSQALQPTAGRRTEKLKDDL